jgi:hypothetical protein
MSALRTIELVFGWSAVIWGAALLAFSYARRFIAPESVAQDVIGFSIILAVLALGVTLDFFFSSLATRILLSIGALAVIVVATISFITWALPMGVLALTAAIVAFALPYVG